MGQILFFYSNLKSNFIYLAQPKFHNIDICIGYVMIYTKCLKNLIEYFHHGDKT